MIFINKSNKFNATLLGGQQVGNCVALSTIDADGWILAQLESLPDSEAELWINMNQVSMCAVVR